MVSVRAIAFRSFLSFLRSIGRARDSDDTVWGNRPGFSALLLWCKASGRGERVGTGRPKSSVNRDMDVIGSARSTKRTRSAQRQALELRYSIMMCHISVRAPLLLALATTWIGCEQHDDSRGPFTLQERMNKGREVAENLTRECEQGVTWRCCSLGRWYTHGTYESNFIIEPDLSKAFPLFSRGCDGTDLGCCSYLGRMYRLGQGTEQNPAKALEAFERGCHPGLGAEGCASAGALHELGAPGVEQNLEKARHFYSFACRSSLAGCARLASLNLRGSGGPVDYARARQLYSRVCAEVPLRVDQAAGCAGLGVIYEKGLGVEPDVVKALRFYNKSCMYTNDRNACRSVERLREVHDL